MYVIYKPENIFLRLDIFQQNKNNSKHKTILSNLPDISSQLRLFLQINLCKYVMIYSRMLFEKPNRMKKQYIFSIYSLLGREFFSTPYKNRRKWKSSFSQQAVEDRSLLALTKWINLFGLLKRQLKKNGMIRISSKVSCIHLQAIKIWKGMNSSPSPAMG